MGELAGFGSDDAPNISKRRYLRLFGLSFVGAALGLGGTGTAAARHGLEVDLDRTWTREERRQLVASRRRFHGSRLRTRGRDVEVRVRSTDGTLLRYDREGEQVDLDFDGVSIAANHDDVDVNVGGTDCEVLRFDATEDGVEIDLGSCGSVEVDR